VSTRSQCKDVCVDVKVRVKSQLKDVCVNVKVRAKMKDARIFAQVRK
jgi:hypothetical protein